MISGGDGFRVAKVAEMVGGVAGIGGGFAMVVSTKRHIKAADKEWGGTIQAEFAKVVAGATRTKAPVETYAALDPNSPIQSLVRKVTDAAIQEVDFSAPSSASNILRLKDAFAEALTNPRYFEIPSTQRQPVLAAAAAHVLGQDGMYTDNWQPSITAIDRAMDNIYAEVWRKGEGRHYYTSATIDLLLVHNAEFSAAHQRYLDLRPLKIEATVGGVIAIVSAIIAVDGLVGVCSEDGRGLFE